VTGSLTDRLQENRFMVVEVDGDHGRLRVKSDGCADLSCHAHTVVVAEDGSETGVGALYPGDIVRIESARDAGGGAVTRIVVLRRVWEGIASPEL
jgi:hypothetical protein